MRTCSHNFLDHYLNDCGLQLFTCSCGVQTCHCCANGGRIWGHITLDFHIYKFVDGKDELPFAHLSPWLASGSHFQQEQFSTGLLSKLAVIATCKFETVHAEDAILM
jgi:hypothetical protein